MAELLAKVIYHEVALVEDAPLLTDPEGGGLLRFAEPLPVGTEFTLEVGGGGLDSQRVPVRVLSVKEGAGKGNEDKSVMRLEFLEPLGEITAQPPPVPRDERSDTDVQTPLALDDTALTDVSDLPLQTMAAPSEPAPSEDSIPVEEAAAADTTVEHAAASAPESEPDGKKKKKKRKKKKKK